MQAQALAKDKHAELHLLIGKRELGCVRRQREVGQGAVDVMQTRRFLVAFWRDMIIVVRRH